MGEEEGIWTGCGHKVKAIIVDNNIFTMAHMMTFYEENPKDLCLECWEKDMKNY